MADQRPKRNLAWEGGPISNPPHADVHPVQKPRSCVPPWTLSLLPSHWLSARLTRWSKSPCTPQIRCTLAQQKGTPGEGQPPRSHQMAGRYPRLEGSPRKLSSHRGHYALAAGEAAFSVRIKAILLLLQTALDSNAQ